MPLTREQTKYVPSNDTVFLPTVAIDRNLGVRGTSVFDGTATFNNGLTVNQSASILGGTINENSVIPGLHAGIQNGTPRLMFAPPGSTSSTNNWQIDVLSGNFRWFTPGILQMSLTPSSLGGTVSTYQILTTGNITSTADNSRIRAVRTTGTAQTTGLGADSGQGFVGSETNTAFQIITNNTARINITAGGDVGIGTSPSFRFDVAGGPGRFKSGQEWSIYVQSSLATSTNRNHIMIQRDNAGTATTNGFNLGGIGIAGFDGTNYGLGWNGGVELSAFAAETWTSTARGTIFSLFNTTVGTNTPTERLRINGDAFGTTTLSGNVIQNVNITAKTGAYTLTTVDANTLVQMNGAFAFTVPLNSTTPFPTGTTINLLAITAGVSVTFTGGITFYATPGRNLRAAGSMATLIKLSTDTWVLTGDLTA
jgi:hypothetical protein